MPFQQMLDNFFSSQRPLFSLSNRVWNPPTDIYEEGDKTYIRMEVAGLDEKTIQVTADRNLLVIRGCRPQMPRTGEEKLNYHLMEIHYGEFERAFAFSFSLRDELIKAQYERGFLLVEVTPPPARSATRVSVEIVIPREDNR